MKLSSMIKAMESETARSVEMDEQKDGIVMINTAGIMMTTNPVRFYPVGMAGQQQRVGTVTGTPCG